ncbi:hypothetical protein RDWZM_005331 [Blomia tropicalis]|uniref:transketolase n=1 Tax=Blomia tropicalis TaxID=40697 RepID=A0A9Q0RM84_BLOTA|nr:hypothetical protein RDWZM_005331 [Blomia tropicalis]
MTLNKELVQQLEDIANRLRINSIRSTTAAKSGIRFRTSNIMTRGAHSVCGMGRGRFVSHVGIVKLAKIDSDLEGHPTPRLNFVDVATGSLGQGLSVAAGMAYVGKYVDKSPYRVYCLIGDGESAEGSIWEALSFASLYKLDNLVAIFDINRLGQSEATAFGHDMKLYQQRLESFGFNAIVVDGHDVTVLANSFEQAANTSGKPTAILAQTYKGKGFPDIEDKLNWHGKPLGDKSQEIIDAISKLIKSDSTTLKPSEPSFVAPVADLSVKLCEPPNYKLGQKVATRQAYGTALVKLGKSCERLLAFDGDTKNSTFSETYKNNFHDRYVECFIAEQNLVGVGIGAGCRKRTIPFVSTFASFFTRTFDQLRMGAISQANIKCVGSHCGVSIGEDGPSQMALEDLAMFRSIPHSVVFYPSDAVSMERASELAAQTTGIVFIRTSRPATPVIYENDEKFQIGQAKVVRSSPKDSILLIGAGITLFEALNAADILERDHKISARVIDPFSIKPLDRATILENANQVGGRVLTVEDHYPEGGLGEAVSSALSDVRNVVIKRLAVREIPRSGPPTVLIEKYGIGAKSIVNGALELINNVN